jgi:ubiquinone/menaquinone biosynthesis C-methylase UbiE
VSDPRPKADVAAAYDRWAATYDADVNRTRDLAAAVLRRHGLHLAGRRVLEIGCGTGLNTPWLAEQSHLVVAADFSSGMLRQAVARVRAPHVAFVQLDLCAGWPIGDVSFEVVVAVLVLEHVPDLAAIFVEAARTLRAGGEVFVCELHPARQRAGRQAEFRAPSSGEVVRIPAHLHHTTEYVGAALQAGFDVDHVGQWRDPGAGPGDLPRLLSMRCRRRAGRAIPGQGE